MAKRSTLSRGGSAFFPARTRCGNSISGLPEVDTIRFLLIAPQGLGDALEATPILTELKRTRPGAAIDVAVLRGGPRELFIGMPDLVARVLYLPYWEEGRFAFARALAANARLARYDASFLAYPASRAEYQMLGAMLGAKRRFGHRYFDRISLGNGLWLQTDLVAVRDVHNVERNLDLVRAAGIEAQTPRGYAVPPSWIGPQPRRPDCVALHVGSIVHDGLESRRWSAEGFVRLIARLREHALDPVLVSGPSERELTRRVASESGVDRIFEGDLGEVARFLSTCGALVANDNGIAHLAAGVGTPTLAIFGPTPVNHGPFGEHAIAFRPSACPPCFDPRFLNTDCALDIDYQCLRQDVTVEGVERALLALLSRRDKSAAIDA